MCGVVALVSGCLACGMVLTEEVASRCSFAVCILPFVFDRPRMACECLHLLTCLRRPYSPSVDCGCPAFALDIVGMSLEMVNQGAPELRSFVPALLNVTQAVDLADRSVQSVLSSARFS